MSKRKRISIMILVILIMQILLPILNILFQNGLTLISEAVSTENNWDVSENQDGSIIATFDDTTATLTISGKGKIKEGSFNSDYLWYSKKKDIAKVLISNGIENIPTRAFEEYKHLREIKLGNTIKTIEYEAFKDCKLLNSIELPEGLEKIDSKVFENCVRLTDLSIPSTVKMVGQEDHEQYGEYQMDVFRGCVNLETISVGENNVDYSSVDGVLFNKDKTKLIYYPEGKKTREYTIPSSVTKIGAYSVYNVNNLTKINVPDGVTKMGDGTFRGCINLTDINVPASVNQLGNDVFDNCTKLKNIIVDENNVNYSSVDGVLFNKDKTTILLYPMGKENSKYTIPNSVITIGPGAFMRCTNLENIEIPNSVVNIEWFAFLGCTGLTEMIIPESVNKIGSEIYDMEFGYVFEDCENLKIVTLPANIDTFYTSYLFKNCRNLEEIIIPEGTLYIGNNAFSGCTNLSKIKFPESVRSIHTSAFQGCSSLTSIEIPSFDSIIPNNCFQGTGLEVLDIPNGITTIYSAFNKCRNLKQINIPDSVTTIRDGTFRGSLLTIKVETNSNESYEIELPEIIKRAIDSNDILYSENGLYTINCTLSENKIIANKDMLEQGKVKLEVRSGALWGLEVSFEATSYLDTEAPFIEDIYCTNSSSSLVLGIGDELSISIRTNEFMKGNPPKLKFRFGNGEERIAVVSDNWNTSSTTEIEYSYTVQEGDNGLLEVICLEGQELTDWSNNKLVTDNIPKLDDKIVANTMKAEEGTIKDEYYITNKEELKNIEELATSGMFDFLGATIYLENDIDLGCNEDNQWIPIGAIYNAFRGTFEGNEHKIKGVYINSEENYQGLLGYNSGIIKNLSLESSYVCSTGNYIGGITGCNYNKATIENCFNEAEVSGNYNVGGISGGNNNPYSGEIRIVNCYNSGNIVGNSSIRRNNRKKFDK